MRGGRAGAPGLWSRVSVARADADQQVRHTEHDEEVPRRRLVTEPEEERRCDEEDRKQEVERDVRAHRQLLHQAGRALR